MKVVIIKAENFNFGDKNKTKITCKAGFKKLGGVKDSGFGSYTEEDKCWNAFISFNLWNKSALPDDKLPGEAAIMDIAVKDLYSFAKKDWVGDDGKERFSIELTLSNDPKGWDSKLAQYMCDYNADWERS